MNKVIIMGRLCNDPTIRQTQGGIASCRFTVAVNRKYVDKSTGERQADFISCIAWRQTAEFVSKYFNKGSMICAEGELRTGSYQDKTHPDVTHYTTDVFVDNVEFTGAKSETHYQEPATPDTSDSGHSYPAAADNDFSEILSDGDLPF